MSDKKISVLVSYPDHFEVVEVPRAIEAFQKLVGGYIEAVPRPRHDSGWFAYCNEEGKLNGLLVNEPANDFMDALYESEGHQAFRFFDTLVGNIVWFSNSDGDGSVETSLPVAYVQRYAATYITLAWRKATTTVVTVIRDGQDIWVFDAQDSLIPQRVGQLVKAARAREEHGTIEVWSGISPAKWVELRVEIMDDVTGIRLHDERVDKSYG